MSNLDLSDAWAIPLRHGYSTVPLLSGSKQAAVLWKEFQTTTAPQETLRVWAAGGYNIGIVTGSGSGVVALDLDSDAAIAEAIARGIPDTPSVATPRGRHYYFQHPGTHVRNAVALFPGADLRGDGGYVVAPGSEFCPSPNELADGKVGGSYRWIVSPDEVPLAPMPTWLSELVSGDKTAGQTPAEDNNAPTRLLVSGSKEQILAAVRDAQSGTRNDILNRAAFSLAQSAAAHPPEEADVLQAELTQAALDAGLTAREIGPTIRSGWAAGIRQSETEATEDGIALSFSRELGDDFIFDEQTRSWFQWTGSKWAKISVNRVIAELRKIARRTNKPALRKASAAKGAEELARSDPVHRLKSKWDPDAMVLCTPNGVVDLSSGCLRAAQRTDFATKETSVAPAAGEAPLWQGFLLEACGSDVELMRFVQRVCGYVLTGDIREQCLLFVYGPGGNGKSVFINTLRAIIHNYAVVSATDTFAASAFAKHPTDVAMLAGSRLVCASETERGKSWDEVRIKQLTGGDPITARYMRCDFFTFEPTFKLIIVGNHKPQLNDVDDAIRRRILIIPFVHRPLRPDLQLERKLVAEYPQILAWMIEGCRVWQEHGLRAPAAVSSATDEYFSEQDGIARWLEDRCEVSAVARGLPSELYYDWCTYAQDAGYPPSTMKSFGDSLVRHGFDRLKTNGGRYHQGIQLRPQVFP